MEIISDWPEIISDWDDDDIEQAIIYLFFIIAGLLGVVLALASLGCRIYALFFPEKGPFPWEDEWGEEETLSEDGEGLRKTLEDEKGDTCMGQTKH